MRSRRTDIRSAVRAVGLISLLLVCSRALGLAPWEIDPQVILTSESVVITWKTEKPSSDARLFWTDAEESKPQRFEAFPEYRYAERDGKTALRHFVSLPFQLKNPRRAGGVVKIGHTIHYRASCIMLDGEKASLVRSKDYAFRVVADRPGARRLGLVFIDGPFVANVLGRQVSVCWELNAPAHATFLFWREGEHTKHSKVLEQKTKRGVVTVAPLRPNTRYFYTVRCVGDDPATVVESRTYHFDSAPKGNATYTFAIMGDSRANERLPDPDASLNGVNVPVVNRLMQLAYAKGARFVLFSGDLISGYTNDTDDIYLQYRTWRSAINPVNAFIPIYAVPGNHDGAAPRPQRGKRPTAWAEDFWRYFLEHPKNAPDNAANLPTYVENVYSFTYGNCFFAGLNSSYYYLADEKPEDKFSARIDAHQRDWLRRELAQNKNARFKFVFVHEPAYPTSSHQKSSLDRLPAERDAFWEILDKAGVNAMFCGHEHIYSRLRVDGFIDPRWKHTIWQITAGGAGAPWYPQNMSIPYTRNVEKFSTDSHVVLATVSGSRVRCKVFNEFDEVIDTFELTRHSK
jgi:3',5'-cyclic AMP phosphodiesterase CpdA